MQSPAYFQGLTLRDLEQLKRSMYLGTAFVEESEMKNFISVSKTFLYACPPSSTYEPKKNPPSSTYEPEIDEEEAKEHIIQTSKVVKEGHYIKQASTSARFFNKTLGFGQDKFAGKRELKISTCSFCDWSHTSRNKLTRHMRDKHTGQSNKCKSCDFKTFSVEKLEIHERKEHNAEKLSCPQCDVKFLSKSSLKNHIRKVHEKRYTTFVCESCEYTTRHGSEIQKHRRIHDGAMIHCDQCEYKTTSNHQLREHIDRLHDATEYDCESCDFRSKTLRSLKYHRKAVHKGISYNCESCGFKTARSENLKQHQRRKHGGERYNCVFCNFGDSERSRVVLHEKRKHPEMLDSTQASGIVPES